MGFEFPLNFISIKFLSKKYRGFIKGMIGADRNTFLPIIRNAIFFLNYICFSRVQKQRKEYNQKALRNSKERVMLVT